jgi:hypothetical protein
MRRIRFLLGLLVWLPVLAAVAILSRRRLLRWILALAYWLVLTPAALVARLRGASTDRDWRTDKERRGWQPLDVSSDERSVYEGEW